MISVCIWGGRLKLIKGVMHHLCVFLINDFCIVVWYTVCSRRGREKIQKSMMRTIGTIHHNRPHLHVPAVAHCKYLADRTTGLYSTREFQYVLRGAFGLKVLLRYSTRYSTLSTKKGRSLSTAL